ncbi:MULTISPECIES: ABC transporter substrate-binding protein [unclassified Bacillus (in: firmicutes)]|uniref:ABC transporter substrate-binding protein n=1 Tax=unclassified Bacillus (in: firmicutes) TaxID=185979 RepID=UPI0008E44AA8|nr:MULTISPECIES: ABC transporter substrate-binding protein [unclassified Bacillus (in: firmicutes)]SFB09757.1 peptide/nickel transport system substrate-binding protein [Bacillus sp. UNCCL13]SFQ86571.1 peptide/nickel transport system substrate-binding protein [Bacillus sp. cl95]
MKKTFKMMLISLLAISLFLVGCNSKSEQTSGEKEPAKNEGSKKSELIYARGTDSTSLDPITTTEGDTFKVTDSIFDTLLTYGEQDTEVKPGLAEKWEVSPDGLTYTFHLVKGVKFHDGTDFNAEAVVFNFERWMNGNADSFPYYSMFGGYKGDEGHVISEVTAVDDSTVKFVLKRPQAPFLKNLAMSPFGIASPTAVKESGDKFREKPVGTGAFKFVEWKQNDRIVLEKNADYWQKGYPKLDKIIFRVIPENTARLNALVNGEIDMMDGLNNSDEGTVTSNANLQLIERPSMNVGYLGFTLTRKPFDNKLVRQALNHAIDKKAIIEAFYAGQAEPAKNPMPPSIEGYNDEVEEYPFDLEKAKALLAEAGYPDGFEMDLWAMPVARLYMPEGMKVAEVIQENFSKIGVKAKIQSVDWATYLDKAAKGEFDAFMLGWTGDNGDADNFLYTLLDKDSIGANNYSYYSNDELHDILIKAQTENDKDKRNELYKQAQVIIHDDAPWVPLVHSRPLMAASKDVTGYLPHPTGSESFYKVEFK